MISSIVFASILSKGDDADQLLIHLGQAQKLGLPVTREQRLPAKSSPETQANTKLLLTLSNVRLKQKKWFGLDFSKYLPVADKLARSRQPFWDFDSSKPLNYKVNNLVNGCVRAELDRCFNSDRVQSDAAMRLKHARSLITNPALFNATFTEVMVSRELQQSYIHTLESIQKLNAKKFRQLPANLLDDFPKPNIQVILKNEFAQTLSIFYGVKQPLTKKLILKTPTDTKQMILFAKNWVTLYPEIRSPIDWTNMQRAYFNIYPEFDTILEDGQEQTWTPSYLESIGILDAKDVQQAAQLQRLRKLHN